MTSDQVQAMLGYDTPTTVPDLLDLLAKAADHLLRDHDCDQHGWEGVERSVREAREASARIRAALAPVCAGCAVRGPWEHRCHGSPCPCADCAPQPAAPAPAA